MFYKNAHTHTHHLNPKLGRTGGHSQTKLGTQVCHNIAESWKGFDFDPTIQAKMAAR